MNVSRGLLMKIAYLEIGTRTSVSDAKTRIIWMLMEHAEKELIRMWHNVPNICGELTYVKNVKTDLS
jgi:hypothetical protein